MSGHARCKLHALPEVIAAAKSLRRGRPKFVPLKPVAHLDSLRVAKDGPYHMQVWTTQDPAAIYTSGDAKCTLIRIKYANYVTPQ